MRRLPAEFEKQSYIQMIFPHKQSDWSPYLEEASAAYVTIVETIRQFQPCILVCDDTVRVQRYFSDTHNIIFLPYTTDDTWARDCSAISVEEEGEAVLLDFTFNGWGNKFSAARDNAMTASLASHYNAKIRSIDFVLEGGAIESDGNGTLLTTARCLLNANRNPQYTQTQIEALLCKELGVERILWLSEGCLSGDDTDAHIDTLARFVDEESIMYLACEDKNDEHYPALQAMKKELQQFTCKSGKPYRLIALPMTEPIHYNGERLPSSYANFLLVNDAVIVPTYHDGNDGIVLEIFRKTFPERAVIGVDCSVLIRQHGSLHCITMQFCEKLAIMV